MSRLIAVCLVVMSCWVNSVCMAGDISADVKSGALWKMPKGEALNKLANGARGSWLDEAKSRMRLVKHGVSLGGVKLGEVLIQFEGEHVQDMTLMVYNKGDDGAISKESFDKMVESVMSALGELSGVEPVAERVAKNEAVVKLKSWLWKWDGGAAVLETNSEVKGRGKGRTFEAEFIRVKLGVDDKSILRNADDPKATKSDLKKNVEVTGKRVVIHNIPMVDQGQKGYCVVATAARMFSYYGMEDIDQHELASLCNASAERGASPQYMAEVLQKIGGKFQIRIKPIDSLYGGRDGKEMAKFLKEYNRVAKKDKKPLLSLSNGIWEQADGDVLRESRAGKQSQIDQWMKALKTYIPLGVPILWSVQVGLVPEPKRISQSRGGHLRMIIGYDEEKKTVIFSDSWGIEHAEKEMPVQDAIAITTGRIVMQPSR